MSKQFWAILAAIVIALVGFSIVTNKKSTDLGGGSTAAATNHTLGQGTGGVTLVEYGDFQCPYCATYYPTVKQVIADYGDTIKFQFRNFPLTSIHQNAFAAARAAEAAGKQNKYWEMYNKLYTTADPNGRTGWVVSNAPNSTFSQYAQQLGLNVEQFKQDAASSSVNAMINAYVAAGNKLGVTGTPTFFLNGKKVQIGNTVDDFKKAIDSAIKNGAAQSSGSTPQSTE